MECVSITTMLKICFVVLVCGGAAALADVKPKLVVDEPVYNFGQVETGLNVRHAWVVRNGGDAPLEIPIIRPTCGCTDASVGKNLLQPGEETTVTATLSLKSQRGYQNKYVIVVSNDPKDPEFNLHFEGEAIIPVVMKPEKVDFGIVEVGDTKDMSVDVTGLNGKKFAVKAAVGSLPSITARVQEIEKDKLYRVFVSLAPSIAYGDLKSSVRLYTDSTQFPILSVPVVAMIPANIAVKPDRLTIYSNERQLPRRYVSLTPGKIKEFQITGVETPDSSITTKITQSDGGGYRVQIDNLMARPELDGKVITIKTDSAVMPEITIPISIEVNAARLRHRKPSPANSSEVASEPSEETP